MQSLAERVKIRALAIDNGIFSHTVCHYAYHIVGGCVAVNAYHIKRGKYISRESLLKHLCTDSTVGGNEHKHSSHIGMDHSASLCDTADLADLAADLKLKRDLLWTRVCRHNSLASKIVVISKTARKLVHSVCNRRNIKRLTDDTRGSHDNVGCLYIHLLSHERAHLLRDLDAVRVTGICISTVANNRLSISISDIALGNRQGRTLNEILRVYCRRSSGLLAEDKRKISLGSVLSDPAMNAIRAKALCGTNAAVYLFYHLFILQNQISSP